MARTRKRVRSRKYSKCRINRSKKINRKTRNYKKRSYKRRKRKYNNKVGGGDSFDQFTKKMDKMNVEGLQDNIIQSQVSDRYSKVKHHLLKTLSEIFRDIIGGSFVGLSGLVSYIFITDNGAMIFHLSSFFSGMVMNAGAGEASMNIGIIGTLAITNACFLVPVLAAGAIIGEMAVRHEEGELKKIHNERKIISQSILELFSEEEGFSKLLVEPEKILSERNMPGSVEDNKAYLDGMYIDLIEAKYNEKAESERRVGEKLGKFNERRVLPRDVAAHKILLFMAGSHMDKNKLIKSLGETAHGRAYNKFNDILKATLHDRDVKEQDRQIINEAGQIYVNGRK
jgi:hypothetical protein